MRAHRSLLMLGLLIAGGLPVTGVATAAGSPEAAVHALLDAIVARDATAIDAEACDGFGVRVAGALDPMRRLTSGGTDGTDGAAGAGLAGALTLRIDDRAVSVIEGTVDHATVAVAGRLTAEVDPKVARAWVAEQLAAAGQPADDAAIDASLEAFLAALAGPRDLASTAEVVLVDGDWRVCGGLGIAVPGSSAPVRADLCALASVEEIALATGLPVGEAWPSEAACTWAPTTGATEPFSLTALLLTGELAPLQAVWKPGRDLEIVGRPAWATRNGTWVAVDDGMLAVLPTLEWSEAARGADAIDVAVRVAKLLVPRLP